jgi:hypothetical protein
MLNGVTLESGECWKEIDWDFFLKEYNWNDGLKNSGNYRKIKIKLIIDIEIS